MRLTKILFVTLLMIVLLFMVHFTLYFAPLSVTSLVLKPASVKEIQLLKRFASISSPVPQKIQGRENPLPTLRSVGERTRFRHLTGSEESPGTWNRFCGSEKTR